MMKKVLSLTLAAIAMLSFGASAQTVNTDKSAKTVKSEKVEKMKRDGKPENCEAKCVKASKDCSKVAKCAKDSTKCHKGKAQKGDRRFDKEGKKKGPKMGSPRAFNPQAAFEGINLTEAQKASLKQLNEKRMARRAEMKNQAKEMKNAQKEASRDAKKAMMADRKKAQKEYLEEVKSIIGPDNYVIFLENMVVNSGSQPKAHGQHHAKAPQKNAPRSNS